MEDDKNTDLENSIQFYLSLLEDIKKKRDDLKNLRSKKKIKENYIKQLLNHRGETFWPIDREDTPGGSGTLEIKERSTFKGFTKDSLPPILEKFFQLYFKEILVPEDIKNAAIGLRDFMYEHRDKKVSTYLHRDYSLKEQTTKRRKLNGG